jgi:NitT/TauT family transport system permease protein
VQPPNKRSRLWRRHRSWVLPGITLVLLVLAWEEAVRYFRIPDFLLPAPSAIFAATSGVYQTVLTDLGATCFTIAVGFLASIAVSLPIAILVATSPLVSSTIYPLLVLVQSVPKVALAPILVVALGANEMPRLLITFLVAFFPVVISSATGLMATPAELLELARSLKANWAQELFRVRLPYAVPYIFSGLKVAATLSVIGAVVAEFVAADRGLGYLLVSSTALYNTPLAFGALVCLSGLAIVSFQVVVFVERAFFAWSVHQTGARDVR